jgi:hypothetical protein
MKSVRPTKLFTLEYRDKITFRLHFPSMINAKKYICLDNFILLLLMGMNFFIRTIFCEGFFFKLQLTDFTRTDFYIYMPRPFESTSLFPFHLYVI